MRVLALALSLLYAGILPTALGIPTDPTWVRGLYDGNDSDDLVWLVVSGPSLPYAREFVLGSVDAVPDRIVVDPGQERSSGAPRRPSGRSPPRPA